MNSPRTRRHDITRQKILDTARKILVERGLAGLSMRTLAEQADYSPSAIYKYFDSKEEILQAIREEFWQIATPIEETEEFLALTPTERLYRAGKRYLEVAAAYPEHYLLTFNSPDAPPGSFEDLSGDSNFSSLINAIQDGVDTGYIKLPSGFTALTLALAFWSTVHGMSMLRLTLMRNYHKEFDPLCNQIMRGMIDLVTVK